MKSICWFKKNSYVKREQIRWLSSPFPKLSQCITVCKQHCISPVSSPPPLEPRLQNSLVIKWARDSRCGNGVHVKRQQHLPSAHHRRREIPPDFITACLPWIPGQKQTIWGKVPSGTTVHHFQRVLDSVAKWTYFKSSRVVSDWLIPTSYKVATAHVCFRDVLHPLRHVSGDPVSSELCCCSLSARTESSPFLCKLDS